MLASVWEYITQNSSKIELAKTALGLVPRLKCFAQHGDAGLDAELAGAFLSF